LTAGNLKFITGLLFLFCVSVQAQTEFFSHLQLIGQAGVSIPQRELAEILDFQPAAGLLFRSPYYGHFKCHTAFHYTPLKGEDSLPEARLLKLAVGLAYEPSVLFLPRVGIELGNYTMIIEQDSEEHPVEYESEFGACPFIYWDLLFLKKVLLQIGLEWDIIFNTPQYSHFVNIKVGAGWRLW
jgi:hypothetical protein